ncbi:lactoylglutathione lyase [Fistulifera solaris]|uniref:Lactoylglutathione lyase n=1 Tax=Fistulifera solaris TaxID=1519565 RepID=A0A1Z5J5K5_FISSO|nr:lactoylglutathione lyase [Fistulifera solaris]|eukprot:GAX09270.1 lactoylglutathione lyase [Fistulifera solaris]
MSSESSFSTSSNPDVIPGRPTWHQTMLRIKDPQKSLEFYTKHLGFTHIDTFDFPQWKFSLYFLTSIPKGAPYNLQAGTQAAHDCLWNMAGTTLELTHNYGTETDESQKYHVGNEEKDGFGHIAVNVDDVYQFCEKLERAGCQFKKKPDEGRMKGLAFVYDPDGYWVEIVKRGDDHEIEEETNFSQTMLRVKDPKKSLDFYQKLGMKLLEVKHFDDFSLYFLGSSVVNTNIGYKNQFQPVLELTHNHGTENDESFKYYNGNEAGRQGFGHIGFLVDDVYQACDAIRPWGYGFRKDVDDGNMKGLAFAYDPDGYSVEIIKRGGIDFGDQRKE